MIKAPNLQIAKAADQTTANPGDVVTYTTTVTNPATASLTTIHCSAREVNAATNLVVGDALPSGLDFVDFTINPDGRCGYNAATRAITCNADTLQPDATSPTPIRRVWPRSSRRPVRVAGEQRVLRGELRSISRTSSSAVAIPRSIVVPSGPAPSPRISASSRPSTHNIVAPGATLTWTVVGTNYGPATSTGFVMADQLPPGVPFVSATASAALSCTTPAVGASGAIRHLHGTERARRAGRRVVADAHDRRDGALTTADRHPFGQHRNRVRQRRRTDSQTRTPIATQTLTLVVVPDQPSRRPIRPADAACPRRPTVRLSLPSCRCIRPVIPAALRAPC